MNKINTFILVLTILVVILVVNFFVSRHPIRFDLTDKKIYTLSESTKKILSGLDDVVTIKVYFTKDLPPALESLRRDVDDMLSEFKNAAGHRLEVEFVDPASSMMEEQKAALLGIPPVQVNVVQKDKQEVAKIYLGMVVMFGGRQEVIPVVESLGNLEYELAQAIIKVSAKDLPKIAWWLGLKKDVPEGFGFDLIKQSVGRRYEVADIDDKSVGNLVDGDFSALVLISPGNLTEAEQRILDQYLMNGGKILALVDRFEIGPSLNIKPIETNAVDMFMKYGATVEDSIVVDRANAMASFSGGYVTYHVPYPFWPEIERGRFDSSEPVVSDLNSAVLVWTAPLRLSEDSGGAKAIAWSTDLSSSVQAKNAKLDPQAATNYLVSGEHRKYPLIALLEGPFFSFFSDKTSNEGGSNAEVSKEGAKIFLVGSSMWASDRTLKTFPANAALFENVLDSFAMGNVLIGIRSRESASRPIQPVTDGFRIFIKYANIAVGPMILLSVGIILWFIRKSNRRKLQMIYR